MNNDILKTVLNRYHALMAIHASDAHDVKYIKQCLPVQKFSFDEKGNVYQVKRAVDKLRIQKPFLFKRREMS